MGDQGAMALEFLANVVIVCFEKWRLKQKYCCSPKSKHFAPQKNFVLATPLPPNVYDTELTKNDAPHHRSHLLCFGEFLQPHISINF